MTTGAATPDLLIEARAERGGSDKLRTEIQALRALAVGSVMLYHLWPNRLSGGYVGVDVFFVISGFLITSHLVSEIVSTGRVRPARFWARRAKRLIPASGLVLLVTTVGILVWAPRYLWHQFLTEIVASTLQAQNWVLARDSVDYLAANNPPSPTQHFWTLSVEEQFYVGLPLILLATGLIRWSRPGRRRTVIGGVLAAVLVSSFAYSIVLTSGNPGLAYFSTFTRAWEFAVGALLAFLPARRRSAAHSGSPSARSAIVGRLADLAPWAGVGAILVACVAFDGDTPFPGYSAALPVLGTAMVIAVGRGTTLSRVGTFRPVALLGRVSYAAYLWHWPILVLLPLATGHPLTTVDKAAIIAASVFVAWLSTVFVEDPIRFNPRLLGGRRPRVVAAWSAVPVVLVVALALGASHIEARRQEQVAENSRDVLGANPRCLGAQSLDPKLSPCKNPDLGGLLVPDIARAAQDDANLAACWVSAGGSPNVCTLGERTGQGKKLLAIGDSHNNTLIDVYRTIAERNGWQVDVAGSGGCYFTAEEQVQPTAAASAGCRQWRNEITGVARAGGYDAIVVTHSDRDRPVVAAEGQSIEDATVDGLVTAWGRLPDVPIIAIRDNPSMPETNLACVADHRDDAAQACAVPRSKALLFDGQALAAARVPRATVLDFTSLYCTATTCPPVIGHVLVYRDPSHLTRTYTRTIAPYVNARVVAALT